MLLNQRKVWLLLTAVVSLFLTQWALAHGMSEAEKQAVIDGGNLRYMWLGATHMLSGYDHLAFVFGIIFFLQSFKDIAKYVTAFTIGHSITLIYATFNGIQLNYFLIDAVIGLSVSYIAFANLDGFRRLLSVRAPNTLVMVVLLGLIHGFGLSTRLQQLPLSEDQLLMNIISFNIGIEIGQIAALFLMLLLIAGWRKRSSFAGFSRGVNYLLIAMGLYLFLMQMHGYDHSVNAEEYTVSVAGKDFSSALSVSYKQLTEDQLTKQQWQDEIHFVIPPRGEMEYKLIMEDSQKLVYRWDADDDLYTDLHAEPAGDSTAAFTSFNKGSFSKSTGILTTAFDGTHGWYWKNTTPVKVAVVLKLDGTYQLPEIHPYQNSSGQATHHDSLF